MNNNITFSPVFAICSTNLTFISVDYTLSYTSDQCQSIQITKCPGYHQRLVAITDGICMFKEKHHKPRLHTINITMGAFAIGMKFQDFKSLESQVEHFERKTLLNYQKSDCRKIKAAAAIYPGRKCKEDLVYAEIKLCCHHGGKN